MLKFEAGVIAEKMEMVARLTNVAAYLPEMAAKQPNVPAIILPRGRDASGRREYERISFDQFDRLCNRYANALESVGVRRGVRTTLMVKPSIEFFALTFALFKIGAVVVMVDPGIGIRNLGKCLAEAEPEAFIGIPKAHAARAILGWGKKSVRTLITVGRKLFWSGYELEKLARGVSDTYAMAPTQPDETAAILFTSGSTGVPKGAVYTHGHFMEQVEFLRERFDIRPGEIDLPTFPLFALFDPALGMTAVIPEMDATKPGLVNPMNIIEAVRDQNVTNTFGSPALLNRVGRYGVEHKIKLPTLKRVFSAGAPVAPAVLERFSKMLEADARIYTPYGATEALPVAAIECREILGETRFEAEMGGGYCVGLPMERVEVRIIRISDEPIAKWSDELLVAQGEVGEIVVKGPNVTREYFNRPDLTALAKIRDVAGGIYHRMGDLGRFDERGRLWFCGRKSHRVTTTTGDMYTIPCEAVFNVHPKVFRTALVGIGERGKQKPVLCVELEKSESSADHKKITNELLLLGAAHPHTQNIRTILFHHSFPVDIRHNAKIGREKLAHWAAKRV